MGRGIDGETNVRVLATPENPDGALDRAIANLRSERNQLLAESDWTGLADTAMTNEKLAYWRMYRQHLRNLPDGLDTEDKVKEVTWPIKPE